MDDKMYVVMAVMEISADSENHPCYSTYVNSHGVAMSADNANKRIRSLTFENATMEYEGDSEEGTIYRHYNLSDSRDSTIAVYVDVVDAI